MLVVLKGILLVSKLIKSVGSGLPTGINHAGLVHQGNSNVASKILTRKRNGDNDKFEIGKQQW